MKTTVTYGEIWRIAYPIIIGSVAQNLLNITDTAFLGRVGQVALGAGAIGGIFYLVFTMLSWGFGIGTQIIIARRKGEGAYPEIGRTFRHAFYFLFPLALALFSVMHFFSGDIMKLIIDSEAVYESFMEYIRYRSFGIFFAATNMVFTALYIGISKTKVITRATVVTASMNVLLDYLLVFGKLGFPEMGIAGAALASVISECAGLLVFLFFTVRMKDRKKYHLFGKVRFEEALYRRMIRISVPVMLQNFFSMAAWLTFFLLIEKLGEQALAVSNIIRSFYVILIIPMWGFSSATNSLVSNLIGQGRQDEVMSFVYKVARLCAIAVLAMALLGSVFPGIALQIYTDDPELIAVSLPALYVVNVAAVLLAVAFIFFSAVSGTGKTQVSFIIEMTVIFFYLILAYILADVLRLKIEYVWITECFYSTSLGILSFFYMKGEKWRSSMV